MRFRKRLCAKYLVMIGVVTEIDAWLWIDRKHLG